MGFIEVDQDERTLLQALTPNAKRRFKHDQSL
jgi:hypothetical protein